MQAGNNAALVDTYYFLEDPGIRPSATHISSLQDAVLESWERLQLLAYRIMTPWRDSFRSCRKAGMEHCPVSA